MRISLTPQQANHLVQTRLTQVLTASAIDLNGTSVADFERALSIHDSALKPLVAGFDYNEPLRPQLMAAVHRIHSNAVLHGLQALGAEQLGGLDSEGLEALSKPGTPLPMQLWASTTGKSRWGVDAAGVACSVKVPLELPNKSLNLKICSVDSQGIIAFSHGAYKSRRHWLEYQDDNGSAPKGVGEWRGAEDAFLSVVHCDSGLSFGIRANDIGGVSVVGLTIRDGSTVETWCTDLGNEESRHIIELSQAGETDLIDQLMSGDGSGLRISDREKKYMGRVLPTGEWIDLRPHRRVISHEDQWLVDQGPQGTISRNPQGDVIYWHLPANTGGWSVRTLGPGGVAWLDGGIDAKSSAQLMRCVLPGTTPTTWASQTASEVGLVRLPAGVVANGACHCFDDGTFMARGPEAVLLIAQSGRPVLGKDIWGSAQTMPMPEPKSPGATIYPRTQMFGDLALLEVPGGVIGLRSDGTLAFGQTETGEVRRFNMPLLISDLVRDDAGHFYGVGNDSRLYAFTSTGEALWGVTESGEPKSVLLPEVTHPRVYGEREAALHWRLSVESGAIWALAHDGTLSCVA